MIAALVTGRLLEKPRRYRTDGDKPRISATMIGRDGNNQAIKVTLDTGDTVIVNHLARMNEGQMLSAQGELSIEYGGALVIRPRAILVLMETEQLEHA